MNTDTNFMSFENLTKLIEEHKKERHPYKRYEFDNTSYTMLLISINNLIKENKELNKKYLNAVVDYEITMSDKTELEKQIAILDKTNIQLISKLDRYDAIVDERDELKKQLTTYQILHRDCKVDNLKNISKIEEKENQQKEFVKYLKDKLRIANEVLDDPEEDEEARGYVLARKFMLEEILSKYQEIIGNNEQD